MRPEPASPAPAPAEAAFAEALARHRAGNLAAAEQAYRRLLETEPDHRAGLNALGLLHLQAGRPREAAPLLRRAVALEPAAADIHLLLGAALRAAGELDGAAEAFRRAAELRPDHPEAHNNLGVVLRETGELAGAEAAYRQALAARPDYPQALNNLGVLLRDRGELAGAIDAYLQAVRLQPDYAEAHANLGRAQRAAGGTEAAEAALRRALELDPDRAEWHNDLGVLRQEAGDPAGAEAAYRRALELRPDAALTHCNLGGALKEQDDLAGAESAYRRALELDPKLIDAHSNLGGLLKKRGELAGAEAACRQALALDPKHVGALSNLGLVLKAEGDLAGAEAAYRRALARAPEHVEAHINLAFLLLARGELAEGWAEYDWRWQSPEFRRGAFRRRQFPQPLWEGGDPAGKTLLVWNEQGLGDELMFGALVPELVAAGAQCIVECHERLASLFARSFPGAEVLPHAGPPSGRLADPALGLQCPMGGLARRLRPEPGSFAGHGPYLQVDAERRSRCRARYAALGPGLKVGISWRSQSTRTGTERSIGIELWNQILSLPDVTFVNLQYGDCAAELAAAEERFGVAIHQDPEVDALGDFDEVAAQIAALDLVISADNTAVHLAGAIGVPVWLLLPFDPDWRWLRDRDDSPWYPSLRLFRQPRPEAWGPALADAGRRLAALAARGSLAKPAAPPHIPTDH